MCRYTCVKQNKLYKFSKLTRQDLPLNASFFINIKIIIEDMNILR